VESLLLGLGRHTMLITDDGGARGRDRLVEDAALLADAGLIVIVASSEDGAAAARSLGERAVLSPDTGGPAHEAAARIVDAVLRRA
jgi:hypothetical protein